jgi:hypothetical protein
MTVGALVGRNSGDPNGPKSTVAAPMLLTVNWRPQPGHSGGATSFSSNLWPQLGQLRIGFTLAKDQYVFDSSIYVANRVFLRSISS